MVDQPENQQPEVPDANLRAAIEGLDDLSNILRQALADDDALAAGGTMRAHQANDHRSARTTEDGSAEGGQAR